MRNRQEAGGVISDKHKEPHTESLLNDRLYYVFFHGLSNPAGESGSEDAAARTRRGDVPFLNGGLFEMQPYDEQHAVDLPNDTFADILNLFERYNFTITESTPLDIEVAVDPEMLGKVFEELVTGRHASGSYYTPRAVVSFMCRESLKLCLQKQTTESAACLTQFVDGGDATGIRDSEGVLAVLQNLRVCDPACGSGAYLLGMMGELLRLRDALFQSDQTDTRTVYERKLEIIRKNLYGVDRDDFAVNIAMLRLWLSLTVDYEGDVPQPLPNLDYKVAVGDSLTGAAPEQMTLDRPWIQKIQEKQADYLVTHVDAKKQALRAEIAALRADLQGWQASADEFVWQVEFPEVFQAGGFDIVIGNPPYVRQELIKAMKPTYKRLFPEVYVGTADLYVYFYKRGTELLRRHGILAYISSNKFLRAAYGRKLRAFFSDAQRIQRLLDFGSVAVFKASVDTCILILENAISEGAPFSVATFRDASDVLRLSAAFRERAFRLQPRDLSAEGWTLASPETLQLLRKLETTGTPLGEYVKEGFYMGVKTGYNKAFIIDAAVRQRLISEDPKSNELIKPLLRGRDLRKWRTDSTGQYLIFTRHGVEIDQYPAVKKHLNQYRRNLEPKKSRAEKYGRKMGSYKWYEIQDVVAYHAEFEKPKILYSKISKALYAVYDTTGAYGLDSTHFIPINDLSVFAILNSRLFDWYARHKFQSLNDPWAGGGLSFFSQHMEKVPMADCTDTQKAEVSCLVEQILAAPESDNVRDIEREIDRWVYRVYGLTDAEVALIQRTYREAGMAV